METLIAFIFSLFRPNVSFFLHVLYFQPIYSGQEDENRKRCRQNVFHDPFVVEYQDVSALNSLVTWKVRAEGSMTKDKKIMSQRLDFLEILTCSECSETK